MRIERVRSHSFVSDVITFDSLVVDLGMNQGKFSREMQQKYRCRTIGVEATPALAEQLSKQNIPCLNLAIAGQTGEITFYIDPSNSEASSLTPVAESTAQPVRVPAITLADLFAREGIRDVDLLKLDIEGAEIDVLTMTDPTLFEHVKQISIEFHIFMFEHHRALVEAILTRMRGLGFYCMDFSHKDWADALFINKRLIPLSQTDRLSLLAQKYTLGINRVVRRAVRSLT